MSDPQAGAAASGNGSTIIRPYRRESFDPGQGRHVERDPRAPGRAHAGRDRRRRDGREIAADAVVVAAGAWAPVTLAPLGIRLAVDPQRGQIIHLKMPGADTLHWATMQPLNGYYLLAFEDGRVVIGATRERGSGFDHRLTAAGVAEVLNAGLATAPGLAGWTL